MAIYKKKYGQYMTPEMVVDFMISLADTKNGNSAILEPSSGEGAFVEGLQKAGYKNITAYEIDKKMTKNCNNVIHESFVSAAVNQKFDLVIGNPPYIRWKNLDASLKKELETNPLWGKHCNSLCDYASIFIIKSIELLKNNGQLIFITPEYWLNSTHSISLRNYLISNGYFEQIFHFNETPIFSNAAVSTIVFKYIKGQNRKYKKNIKIKITKYFKNKKANSQIFQNITNKIKQNDTEYFTINQFETNRRWILAPIDVQQEMNVFEAKCKIDNPDTLFPSEYYTIKEFCDIGNGMVSGLDKTFQINDLKLNKHESKFVLKVAKAKSLEPFIQNEITKYFLIEEGEVDSEQKFKKLFPNIYNAIIKDKKKLNKRYNYNRTIHYWEWALLRNFKLFQKKVPRIFVPCKERISNKNHFRFAFAKAGIYPTQDVTAIFPKEGTKESIYYILAMLNSKYVFDWLRFNGIVKGNIVEFSEKPIASIPYKKIDFNNSKEKKIHDTIVNYTKNYINNKEKHCLKEINIAIDKLFST